MDFRPERNRQLGERRAKASKRNYTMKINGGRCSKDRSADYQTKYDFHLVTYSSSVALLY